MQEPGSRSRVFVTWVHLILEQEQSWCFALYAAHRGPQVWLGMAVSAAG